MNLAILLTALSLVAATPRAPAQPPNIVLVLADDLGINDLGSYGRKDHHTPHLDRLAREGLRFTSFYAAQPICSPSRAALLTGKTPARLHLTTYLPGRANTRAQKVRHPEIRQALPLGELTLAEVLKAAGYATAAIGKWHLGNRGFGPQDQGFDVAFAGHPNTTPSATEGGKGEYELESEAERFIEENQARRFFLYLAHNNPHIPLAAKPELIAKNAGAWNPLYAAVIETLDDTVGRLLAKLETLGIVDRTIVLFASDNGGLHVPEGRFDSPTHNTPFRAGKGFLHEGGLRVPLFIRWPGKVKAGVVTDAPVMNTDLLPTLLALARVPAPPRIDGQSFAPLVLGQGAPRPRPLFWHFPHYTNQGSRPAGAVRDGRWKLIAPYDGGPAELFDLYADPKEEHDLAGGQPKRIAAMTAQLVRWRKQVGAQENQPNPDVDMAAYGRLYQHTDVSRLAPAATAAETARPYAAWRAEMDAVAKAK